MRLRAGFLLPLLLVGCLGRTGIGDDDLAAAGGGTPGDDAFVGDSAVGIDSGLPGTDSSIGDSIVVDSGKRDSRPPPPDSIDFFDIFPIPDGGPLGACATCVADHCAAQVNACLNDATCRAGLLCTVTTCLGGGGPGGFDITCVLGCFGGDFSKAAEAISAFTCVISNCGSTCGGFLGGGDAGGPGGPPPPRDAGGGSGEAGAGGPGFAPMTIDHTWTAEEVMSIDPSTRMSFSPEAFDAWRDQLASPAGCASH